MESQPAMQNAPEFGICAQPWWHPFQCRAFIVAMRVLRSELGNLDPCLCFRLIIPLHQLDDDGVRPPREETIV